MFPRRLARSLTLVIGIVFPMSNLTAQELSRQQAQAEPYTQSPSDIAPVRSAPESDPEVTVNNVIESNGSSNMLVAREAYDRGRKNLSSALFPDAEVELLKALKYVPDDTSLKENIESSLYIDLPLGAVNQLVASGRVEEAQALLEKAILIAKTYPSYMEQLQAARNDLLATDIFSARPKVVIDGSGVVDSVYQKMLEYRRLNGRYPSNRRVLDRWLPEGRPPLEHFKVSSYRPVLGGYSMIIQNKTDPDQTLRIDATGVLQ